MKKLQITKNLLVLWMFSVLFLASCSAKQEKIQGTKNAIVSENEKEGTTDWLIDVPYKTCDYPDHQYCRREALKDIVRARA